MNRLLLRAGAVLFLLGLLIGLVTSELHNPRAGLSAHLEGVMNGTFLLAVGAIWPQLSLGQRGRNATQWLLLWGTTANLVATLLSAVFGTSKTTPIAGAGFSGSALQEGIVGALLVSVALTMVAALVLLVIGLGGEKPAEPPSAG